MIEKNIKRDIGIGLFFLLFALCYFIGTFSIESYNPFGDNSLSSKAIPQLLAAIMGILGLFVLIPAVTKACNKKNKGNNNDGTSSTDKLTIIKIFTAVILLVLYISLFDKFGFILSSLLYLFFMIVMLLPDKKTKYIVFTLVFSTGVSVLIYMIFNKCLGLILPSGVLGF
jgi:putative tricarboxylic transport membrane protein